MSEWIQQPDTVDHSTLAAFCECPSRGRMVSDGIVTECSRDLLVGQELHDCLARVTKQFIRIGATVTNTELASWLREELAHVRPDLQPSVLDAIRPTVWSWANWLWEQGRLSIMRHDGGEGQYSGQLAVNISGVLVTSELDLLLATPSPELVRIVDYKSGWSNWDEDAISNSLQFQLHAFLVMTNYEQVESVDVRVWKTRTNSLTHAVRFKRTRMDEIRARLEQAVEVWKRNRQLPLAEVDCHPKFDYCQHCPALLMCEPGQRCTGVFQPPEGLLSELVQLTARCDRITEILSEQVDATGQDVTVNGHAFGLGKPKANRKPTKSLYSVAD